MPASFAVTVEIEAEKHEGDNEEDTRKKMLVQVSIKSTLEEGEPYSSSPPRPQAAAREFRYVNTALARREMIERFL